MTYLAVAAGFAAVGLVALRVVARPTSVICVNLAILVTLIVTVDANARW